MKQSADNMTTITLRLLCMGACTAVVAVVLFVSVAFAAPDNLFSPRGPGGAGGTYAPSFSPYTKDLVFIGTDMGAAFRSTTSGQSWELIHWKNELRFLQHSPKPAYFPEATVWSTRFRILTVSTDNGASWEKRKERPWDKEKVIQLHAIPGNPNVLLVGATNSVWRSEDMGRSYEKVWASGVSEFVELGETLYCMAQPNVLLASNDQGKTWKATPVSLGGVAAMNEVQSFTGGMSPDGHVLFASLKGIGLIRSRDKGASWELVLSPYKGEKLLLMDKGQDRIIYAAQIGSAKHKELLRSSDGGESWEGIFRLNVKWSRKLFENPNVKPSWAQTELYWGHFITNRGVGMDPYDSNHLILTTQGDIYETRDGGDSWAPIINRVHPPAADDSSPRYESIGLEITSCWNYYFDPFNPDRHYAVYSDIGFVRSIDKGKTWMWAAKGSPWRNSFYEIAFDPDVEGRIYAAASARHDIPHDMALSPTRPNQSMGGVVVSDNGGKSWKTPYDRKSSSGLPGRACTSIAVDLNSPKESRTLYAGLFGESERAGVYRSDDGGKNWVRKSNGLGFLPNMHVLRVVVHPKSGNIYCLISGLRKRGAVYKVPGGVWKSTDKGESWAHISAGSDLNWHATSLTINPVDEKEMYVTATSPAGRWLTGGLYRTTDGGEEWDHILTDKQIAKAAGGKAWDHTMSFAIHPDDSKLMYVGTSHHGLLFSRDGGQSWESYAAFPFNVIQSITAVPWDHSRIMVTTFGSGMWEGPYLPQ